MSLIDSSIGTPEATAPEKVRDQRAIAALRTMSPMWIGMRRLIRSHCALPLSVLFHWKKPMIAAIMAGNPDKPIAP